jgi:protease I
VIEIVKHFAQNNKPIASICHGVQVLTAADVVKGKRVSAYPACGPEVTLAGGKYENIAMDAAITDGNLVSSPAWPSHPALLSQFMHLLGIEVKVREEVAA